MRGTNVIIDHVEVGRFGIKSLSSFPPTPPSTLSCVPLPSVNTSTVAIVAGLLDVEALGLPQDFLKDYGEPSEADAITMART